MKKQLYAYKDVMKEFLKKVIIKIPYFGCDYLNKHLFHKVLYSLEVKYYPKGDIILKEDDETWCLFIVTHGELEVYTEFDGNEFIIETLKEGSVLNHRVLFSDEQMFVNVRCKYGTHLAELNIENFNEIRELDKKFSNKLLMYENQLLRKSP